MAEYPREGSQQRGDIRAVGSVPGASTSLGSLRARIKTRSISARQRRSDAKHRVCVAETIHPRTEAVKQQQLQLAHLAFFRIAQVAAGLNVDLRAADDERRQVD